ncbi:hypothetical protein [Sphingobium sp. UBA5915]|uniref:hypothetical protein n=1 Tax=Sphingobium sp. UBA5915 TaxID=1947530 RepID=UPI0025FCB330|nr:hypothetical protein [Sphingobium sp. UBA5915]
MSYKVEFHVTWMEHWPGLSGEEVDQLVPDDYELDEHIEKWFKDKGIEPDIEFRSVDVQLVCHDYSAYLVHVSALFEHEADALEFEQTFPKVTDSYG